MTPSAPATSSPVLPTLSAGTPTAIPPTAAATPEPPAYALYRMNVVVDYAAHYVAVEETITYPNLTGETLTGLVLSVEPNFWPECFLLSELSVDGQAPAYALNGHWMEIGLPAPLAPGATTSVYIHYALNLPWAEMFVDPNDSRPRIFGWMARQTNLVHWYPFVVPYQAGQGWILHEPYVYGEHLVYDPADFEVTLRFTDPANAPAVASSGAAEATGDATVYRLERGRTFAFSFSPQYGVYSQQVGEVTVYSYYFTPYEDRGRAVLRDTARALELYSERFGPYPHATLTAVAADFADGMEYSGLYFLSRDFYKTYDGTPQSFLTAIAVHETAHQWWFDIVASDQALEPWLDESLCTYTERIFYETYYPEALSWWWQVRVDYSSPAGFIDLPVAATTGYEAYRRATYLNGAHFFEGLRQRIGDEAFFAFLADYATQFRFRRATSADFFALLRQHTTTDISDLITYYFSLPHR